MKLFDQTTLSDPATGSHGDCFRAAIRTLAQADMPDLPHPIDAGTGGWNLAFFDVLEDVYGYTARTVRRLYEDRDLSGLPRVVLAAGPTERSDPTTGMPLHSVVWDRGANRMVHDPHPSHAGLTAIVGFDWLEPT